jgi:hypothetical protein
VITEERRRQRAEIHHEPAALACLCPSGVALVSMICH